MFREALTLTVIFLVWGGSKGCLLVEQREGQADILD